LTIIDQVRSVRSVFRSECRPEEEEEGGEWDEWGRWPVPERFAEKNSLSELELETSSSKFICMR